MQNKNESSACPFCTLQPDRIIDSNEHGVVIRDGFPVSPGHTLIIPRDHKASFFEMNNSEREALMFLLERAKKVLDKELSPAAWNIGINDGVAAGQTVPHLHIHLIPRYAGDRSDPRGGIRWVIPDRADYWSTR